MVLFRSRQPDVQIPEHLTTWDWLFESREYSPLCAPSDKPLGAYIDAETGERLDYAEVKSKSTALSTCLIREYDLKPGDTVSLFSGNTIWYPVCMFAALRAGARINGASPALTADEMAFALQTAKTKILITPPSSLDRAMAAAKQVGLPVDRILLIYGLADGFKNVQDLIEDGAKMPVASPFCMPEGMSSRALCGYLNFSSGTTGLPKAVMISHYNMIAQTFQMAQIQVDPDRVKVLAVMPLFHITGTWRFCHYPIFMNGDTIMLPAFTMPAMLKAIVKYQVEELVLVPPILLRLARDAVVSDFDLHHVKRFTSGAAPVSAEVLKSLKQRFPWTGFRQGYGATESTTAISANPPTHYDYKYAASAGMLVAGTSAKVVDPDGKELGLHETGELLVKGPQIAMGYLENDVATSETFDNDGFFHTGDSGYFDNEGLLYIVDRIKEMIKVKGTQVPPAELEDLLLGHEDVADCAVVGQPDEYAGERPKAFVVLKKEVIVNQAAGHRLLDYVRRNKVRYKWLVEIEFIDQIPKSPAGKLLRRVLRDRERNRAANGFKEGLRVMNEERSNSRTQD